MNHKTIKSKQILEELEFATKEYANQVLENKLTERQAQTYIRVTVAFTIKILNLKSLMDQSTLYLFTNATFDATLNNKICGWDFETNSVFFPKGK